MGTVRSDDDARLLEQRLVVLRWIVAAFGAVQVGFAIRDRASDPTFVLPLGVALVVGLTVGNVAIAGAARKAEGVALEALGILAFALDALVILGLVWLATDGPADPVWVVGYLIPLEGAARWGLLGAALGAAAFLAGQLLPEFGVAAASSAMKTSAPVIAFRAGMALVVGAVAGSFASLSRREAAEAERRARDAEAAAARAETAAAKEGQARGEVAAFHAAAIAEPDMNRLAPTLQPTVEAIAKELGCDALGILVRDRGSAGEVGFVAYGVYGDPGYLRGDRLFPASAPVAAAALEGAAVIAPPDAVVPMVVRGEIVGALHERSENGGGLDDERGELLRGLADQLGLVLESARLRADQAATVQRLRELDEMKSDFVAITSHELRTPLSGIRGFVDMLRRRGSDLTIDQRDEYLSIVLTQTDRLIRLVEDLLVVSRVEAGKLSLEPTEVEVRQLLEHVTNGLGEAAASVRIEEGTDAPVRMVADPNRLIQVLTNLVHNAVKFSPAGATVALRWRTSAEGTVSFDVVDLGPGIPESEVGRIFERFHQRESSLTHTEGFGLGLYISKLLTEAMGGWIHVTSAVGEGSTFTVTLPSARTLPAPARPSAPAHAD
ncbi:MAG TPA: ATP-binding protein [Actinomycetota bacterium]